MGEVYRAESTKDMSNPNPSQHFEQGNQTALKEMNWDLLDSLIGIFCTLEECSAVLNLGEGTIDSKIKEKFGITFRDYYKQKSATGRASLRRRQFEMSKTNPALAIWLGKQYLGQTDTALIDQSNHTHITINRPKVKSGNRLKTISR